MIARPPFAVVVPELPWPANQGSRRFVYEALRVLAQLGEVHCFTRESAQSAAALQEFASLGIHLHLDQSFRAQDPWRRLWRRLGIDYRAWRAGHPREFEFVCSPGVRRLLAEHLKTVPESILIGIFWSTAPLLDQGGGAATIYIASDVESQVLDDGRAYRSGGATPQRVDQMRAAELAAFSAADLALCLSEADCSRARNLLRDGRAPSIPALNVWPVSIPVPESPRALREADDHQQLLIYGHWTAEFNRDGLEDFLQQVWPLLYGEDATRGLRLVGAGLDLIRAKPAGAERVGWVDDLDVELASADAVLIPLRYAGGVRYRMLEAMAAGRPVICSSVAAGGLGAIAGTHYLCADSREEWTAALVALQDQARMRQMAISAHQFVSDHFSRANLSARVRAAFAPLLNKEKPGDA